MKKKMIISTSTSYKATKINKAQYLSQSHKVHKASKKSIYSWHKDYRRRKKENTSHPELDSGSDLLLPTIRDPPFPPSFQISLEQRKGRRSANPEGHRSLHLSSSPPHFKFN